MTEKDFIKLECTVFSKFDKKTVLEMIKNGTAEDLRKYAQCNDYKIAEIELLEIIKRKNLSQI